MSFLVHDPYSGELVCEVAAAAPAQIDEAIDGALKARPDSGPEEPRAALQVVAEPVDLAIAITPFNHPLNHVVHKIAPAIAAGACVVLKPSEKTPSPRCASARS